MTRFLAPLLVLLALAAPALAQTRALPGGEIRANGDITFGNALKLGKREGNKTIITPDTLQILGPDSTGDVSKMSATPNLTAPEGTLAKALGDISGFKAPGASGFARLNAAYYTINSRLLSNSPPSGEPINWLGNSAGGDANNYAYGNIAQGVFLSGIGDVGLAGATRTEDVTTPNRLSIGTMGWAFNFKTVAPQTAWGGYFEARRKKGAGQIHALEVNCTDLGDGSDTNIPSAMKNGPNAVYSAPTSCLNIAAGGNVTPNQQTGWDGQKLVTQAADAGVAIPIYSNGAKFKKGIIIGENAITGCDGTGSPNTCTGVELGRGTDIGWIDGSTRIASLIRSDLSPSANGLRLRFTDFGAILDGYGGATLNVVAKASDVNGVQVIGGGSAAAPVRIVAAGSPNASLGISASGGGMVQMQSVMRLPTYTVATLPVCDATREGGMAYVTDSAAVTYRNGVNNGGGSLKAPVFCTGVVWEYH